MQVTQADASKYKRAGVEDFTDQPTSHTNKMKKYIRSKNAVVSESPPPLDAEGRASAEVHPPLPLDPPPPDKPPNMALALKEEVEDADYGPREDTDAPSTSDASDEFKSNEGDTSKSKTMCRDFFRGKCTRLGSCRFSHKCDVSQLNGIYTFCNDFQNTVCTRPSCKYVHATVFEEQRFYRTGELPLHAFAHHNKKVTLLPPPPPPPEEPPTDLQHIFKIPPPPLPTRRKKPTLVKSPISPGKFGPGGVQDDMRASLATSEALNRDWSNSQRFGSPSSSHQHEPDQRECKKCEVLDLRTKFVIDKLEKIRKAKQERIHATKVLSIKSERLNHTLRTLLRPAGLGVGGLVSSQNNAMDRQKALLEQINALNNNLMTGMADDSNRYQGHLGGSGSSQNNASDRQKWLVEQLGTALNSNLVPSITEDANRGNFNGNQPGSNLLKMLFAYVRTHLNADASRNT